MNNNYYPPYSEYENIMQLMTKDGSIIDGETGEVRPEVDKPQMQYLLTIIDRYKRSTKVANMNKSTEYYLNNTAILDSKRYVINGKGIAQEDKKLSNAKLNHPIVNKIVNQKTSFLLSKPFTVQTLDNEEDMEFTSLEDFMNVENYLKPKDDEGQKFYNELTKHYFDKNFMQKLKNTGREAVTQGISWMHPYYDGEGKLKFARLPATNIIPFYKDSDMQELEALCYFYEEVVWKQDEEGNLEEEEVTKVKFYNHLGIWNYEITWGKNEGNSVISKDRGVDVVLSTHYTEKITTTKGNEVVESFEGKNWDRIPFVPFRDNWLEIPIVTKIGNLVDEYDRVTSTISNILNDIPNSILVVKNYNGQDKSDFQNNLAVFRTLFILDDGDAKYLDNDFSIDNFEKHIERLKKDIYEGSSTVDTQETSLGNASGVALKYRLMDLDVACDDMGNEFETGLDGLIYFILQDMEEKDYGSFYDIEYDIIFNTDMIINEEEAVLNAQRMKDVLSDEDILDNLPMVQDTKKSMRRKFKGELRKIAQEYMQANLMLDLESEFGSSVDANGDTSLNNPTSKNFADPRNLENSDKGNTRKSKSPAAVDEVVHTRTVNKATVQKASEPKK